MSKKEENFDKFVFYFCVIDHLFLPYVWFVSIPYSLPVILLWFIRRYKYFKHIKEYSAFIVLLALMAISTFYSIVVTPGYIYKNMVYFILFTAMFLYYFMFTWYLSKYIFYGKYFIIAFLIFVVIFAVLFNIDKSLYYNIRLIWNRRSGIGIDEPILGSRYSFIWMDANNIAYMVNSLVLYLWCNEKSNFLVKISSVIALIYILISCMSNGGFITFFIGVFLYLITTIVMKRVKVKDKIIRLTPIKIILSLVAIFVLSIGISKIPEYLETNVVKESLNRLDNNSGDSRVAIWINIVDKVNFSQYMFLGKGGVTLVDGEVIAPHNGHIYWILAYGFISYIIFMYLIFRKRKTIKIREYIFMIPILFGFTINVLLGETKMMCIIMLFIAYASSNNYLAKVRMNETVSQGE